MRSTTRQEPNAKTLIEFMDVATDEVNSALNSSKISSNHRLKNHQQFLQRRVSSRNPCINTRSQVRTRNPMTLKEDVQKLVRDAIKELKHSQHVREMIEASYNRNEEGFTKQVLASNTPQLNVNDERSKFIHHTYPLTHSPIIPSRINQIPHCYSPAQTSPINNNMSLPNSDNIYDFSSHNSLSSNAFQSNNIQLNFPANEIKITEMDLTSLYTYGGNENASPAFDKEIDNFDGFLSGEELTQNIDITDLYIPELYEPRYPTVNPKEYYIVENNVEFSPSLTTEDFMFYD